MLFIKEEYEMLLNKADLVKLFQEIEYEIREYAGEVSDDFVLLHDSTVYQILQVVNMLIGLIEGQAETKILLEIVKD